MSPNANNNNENQNNQGLLSQARDYLNRAVQTDEQRAKEEYGKKQVAERMMDKFLDREAPKPVQYGIPQVAEREVAPKPATENGGNIVDKARNEIYQLTMSEEQKKWNKDAEKSILDKAHEEAKEKTESAFSFICESEDVVCESKDAFEKETSPVDHDTQGPIGHLKNGSTVQRTLDGIGNAANAVTETTDSAAIGAKDAFEKEASPVDHDTQGPIGNCKNVVGSTVQRTLDGIGNAANAATETAGSAASGAKDAVGSTVQGTLNGIGNAANAIKETAGSAASGAKEGVGAIVRGSKEHIQGATDAIGQTLGGSKDEVKNNETAKHESREISEKSIQDGAVRLGDTVAEQAKSVVEDIKFKFEDRLNENSAGEKIQREESSNSKKSLQGGVVRLDGNTVAEQAKTIVEDFKSEVEGRLNGNSAREKTSNDSKKN